MTDRSEYQGWYKRAIWTKGLRPNQLARQPLCERCLSEGIVTAANVVNHRDPHKGDWSKFADPDNLESTCKRHHDADIQSEERRGYSKAVDASGWPTDPRHPANAGSAQAGTTETSAGK